MEEQNQNVTKKSSARAPSIRLTRILRDRIIGNLRTIIPWREDERLIQLKEDFLSTLSNRIENAYPVEDMNVVFNYMFRDQEQLDGYLVLSKLWN